jgi:hypothetical protein
LLPKATRLWLARGWLADLALQRQEIKHALRLVALGTPPGAAQRAPVRNRARRRHTGVLEYLRDAPFARRVRQIERGTERALCPSFGPTASGGCCPAPSQRREKRREEDGTEPPAMLKQRSAEG